MSYFLIPYILNHSSDAVERTWLAPTWLVVLVLVLIAIAASIALVAAVWMVVIELREWKEEHQKPKEK